MRKYIILFAAGCSLALTGCSSTQHSERTAGWSVVGAWYCTNPSWNPTIISLAQNGRFYFGQKDAGHWTLTGSHDRVILVLDWRRWPTDTLTLMDPDDFSGNVHGGEFTMRRVVPAN